MPSKQQLTLPARTLAFDCSGPAPELGVLLQHGHGSSRAGTKVRALSERLDQRGCPWAAVDFTAHGESTGEARELSITRLADDVASVVDHLRSEQGWTGRVVLAGSSMGGVSVAWAAAERLPDVAGLYLVAPAMRLVEQLLQSLAPGQAEAWEESGRIAREHRGWKHELGWELVADWRERDHEALAGRLPIPITLVQGALDDRVPLSDARAFAAGAPDLRLVEIPDGDHRLHDSLPLLGDELEALIARLS